MDFKLIVSFSQETLNVLNNLAGALGGKSGSVPQSTVQNTSGEAPVQTAAPQPQYSAVPQAPVQPQYVPQQPAYAPQQNQAPVQPVAGVPTTAQTYSMEQLAVAATQIVDAGRRNELVSLLATFGVQALTVLPKEQYGAFATQLRAMGAKI